MSSLNPSYSASFVAAKGHAQGFLQSTIGHHPVTAAVLMAVLVLVIIYLMYSLTKCHSKSGKGTFGIRPYNNLHTGNNNPLWWHGSGDAGWGGPVHREATDIHLAAYMPQAYAGLREGLSTGPASPCPAGTTAVSYQDEGGALLTRCVSSGYKANLSACKAGWDPTAVAEAQALATVGAYQHDDYGEASLQAAINAAYDAAP
jgi:hypothetical protein